MYRITVQTFCNDNFSNAVGAISKCAAGFAKVDALSQFFPTTEANSVIRFNE